ncbi:hypothetical protein [Rudaea cellulosilytica]|uniref:hypothetical protein n=1 Tax=Rudaea cellulosilytica TaxID=540746 RepID=UPI00036A1A6D|nr:hypothetical protein [Rudaea cellulosilytica]
MALRAFIAASLLVVAGLCRAQGVAYTAGEPSTIDNSQMIYRVDLTTRSTVPVGSAGLYNADPTNPFLLISGLTFGTDQKLYAVGLPLKASQPLLVTLNPVSGSASVVGPLSGFAGTPSAASLSLSFSCDGRLWMASSENNNFWEVTPTNGQTRLVGNLGVKLTSLAAKGGTLYGFGGSGNANLYSINMSTATAGAIGAYGIAVPNPVDGAFDASGTLWSLLRNYNDLNNSPLPSQLNTLAQIDPAKGTMSTLGTIADPKTNPLYKSRMRGLAIAPPVCVDPPPPTATVGAPMLSPMGLGALVASMFAAALLGLRGRRRNGFL